MPNLNLAKSLRRFRRLHGIKQNHLAEMLGVSQGSVSRWESGAHEPEPAALARLDHLVASRCDGRGDAALKRLITTSPLRLHLICDATHRLLAASPARAASWRTDVGAYLGSSLWRFASQEIITQEGRLADRGWFDQLHQNHRFHTNANDSDVIVITAGPMEWENIALADGRIGRLTTALPPIE